MELFDTISWQVFLAKDNLANSWSIFEEDMAQLNQSRAPQIDTQEIVVNHLVDCNDCKYIFSNPSSFCLKPTALKF